jgi:prepilin-type N-terminal cleavage/methylation domain-containing protein
MKQHIDNKGFTLIELLIVIAIIGILAAMLQPAVFKALAKAKTARVQADVKSIETAIRAYYNEYSKLPAPDAWQGASGDRDCRGTESQAVISRLTTNNPRRIVFLEVPAGMTGGTFTDLWGMQYAIVLDTDYNGQVIVGTNTVYSPGIAYSAGPDRNYDTTADNIYSFK